MNETVNAMKNKQVTLLQVRDDETARIHEQECFANAGRLAIEDLQCIDLVHGPRLEWSQVDRSNALLIGGAGAHSAVEDHPFTESLTEVVLRWIEVGRPIFGSCWGHHFLAKALGGEVVHDRAGSEIGSFPITLTPRGGEDPLFEKVPETFVAQLGHHDRVKRLPPGAVELAFSERCRNQAFKLESRPVYGTQFHSELDAEHLMDRLRMYDEEYLDEETNVQSIAEALRSSPHAHTPLRRFLEQFG